MPETPERYSDALKRWGGTNLYGEPCFILSWGASPVVRRSVPAALLGPYLDAWVLAEWTGPEEFGSPEQWDSELGPYPHQGMYLPLQTFRRDGKPIMLDTEDLNLNVLRLFLHVIMTHKFDSLQRRVHFLKDEFAKKKSDEAKARIDMIEDGAPAFLGAASFRNQLNCNSVVMQRAELIEKNLERIRSSAARFAGRKLMQGGMNAHS